MTALAASIGTGNIAGIAVDDQFTVFGSSGAVVVTALTVVLPVLLNAREREQS
jgi:Na+/alanine symporter